jgi:hypothetical protein
MLFCVMLARRLFTLCSATSLLLFLLTCAGWIRSYTWADQLAWSNAGGYRSVKSSAGFVSVNTLRVDWSNYPREHRPVSYTRDKPFPPFDSMLFLCVNRGDRHLGFEFAGLSWHGIHNDLRGTYHDLFIVPFRFLALFATVLPLTWTGRRVFERRRARRTRELNLCPVCGYDLRATPHRCPECGTAVAAAAD